MLFSSIDCPSDEIELSNLFVGVNEEAWYWLLSLLQMANHNIGITMKGLHNGVHISSSEKDRQTSSICDSYVVSNGLYADGFAQGGCVCVRVRACVCVTVCFVCVSICIISSFLTDRVVALCEF